MKNLPLVSVIIPVYNGSNYLGEAVNSVLDQSYKNCEIIIVNDGSVDSGKTREIALSYGDRVRYIEKENGGVATALNHGVQVMKGEYFAWLSHDDLFLPDKIEKQVAAILNSGGKSSISIGNYGFFSSEHDFKTETAFHKYFEHERICDSVFLFFWGETHFSSLLFHKSHFERIGAFNTKLITAQDNEFIFRLLRGQKIVFVEELVSKVRMHKESETVRKNKLVNEENSNLYFQMANQMSQDEINSVFGAESIFYCKVAGIVKSMGGETQQRALEKKMAESMTEPESKLYTGFKSLRNGTDKALVIFGAGQYGIRLKYELNARNIFPVCFIDNDPKKNGSIIDGIPCHTVEYITEHPDCCAIIAQKAYKMAYEQLKNIGKERIILKEEVDGDLYKMKPSIIPSV